MLDVLLEVLPYKEEYQLEMSVWFQFMMAALVDGLAFHALFRPERLTKERLKSILVHHLNTVFQS